MAFMKMNRERDMCAHTHMHTSGNCKGYNICNVMEKFSDCMYYDSTIQ